MKQYILYNPLSASGRGEQLVRSAAVLQLDKVESELLDVTKLGPYADFFARIEPDCRVVLCGGDGTVSRFANETRGITLPEELYYFASGTGNDLLHDLGLQAGSSLVRLAPYLERLPTVEVNGRTGVFLNNVSFGIDGWCCEEGDRLRAQGKKVNYTKIALHGLFGRYRSLNATVTVDGVKHEYRRVWLAPTMHGRFCGGGMMMTPAQDRTNPEGTVSSLVFHDSGVLRALCMFPSLFKGKHVKYKNHVTIVTGHEVVVEFDRPSPLQIDGETVSGVRSYRVRAAQ